MKGEKHKIQIKILLTRNGKQEIRSQTEMCI